MDPFDYPIETESVPQSPAIEPTNELPTNNEAEQSLLGSIMMENKCLPEVLELVATDDFFDERHKALYDAMMALFNAEKPIDFVTLTDQIIKDGKLDLVSQGYINEVYTIVATSANYRSYAQIVVDTALRRRIIEKAAEIQRLASAGEGDANTILDVSTSMIMDLAKKHTGSLSPVQELMQTAYSDIAETAANPERNRGIATGYSDLDRKLLGMKKGSLVLIAARPSMGKSAFALNVASNIALNTESKTAIFSLEMSRSEVIGRVLSSITRIQGEKFQTGQLSAKEWKELADIIGSFSPNSIFVDDSASPTVTEIRAKCHRLKADKGLDILIIDHILLMQGQRRTDNRQQEIAEISRALKILAKDLDIVVIAVSQLNRAADARHDKRPVMSDLRDSGAIEQDADVVMLLYRDDYYNQDTEEPGIAEIILAKNRNGETGTIKLAWNNDITRFESLEHNYDM